MALQYRLSSALQGCDVPPSALVQDVKRLNTACVLGTGATVCSWQFWQRRVAGRQRGASDKLLAAHHAQPAGAARELGGGRQRQQRRQQRQAQWGLHPGRQHPPCQGTALKQAWQGTSRHRHLPDTHAGSHTQQQHRAQRIELRMASDELPQWLQLQSLLGSAAASSSASYSSGSRPRTPTAAEEYARCLQPRRCFLVWLLAAMCSRRERSLIVGWCIAVADWFCWFWQLGGEWRLRCIGPALPAVRCPAGASAWQLPPAPLTAGDPDSAGSRTPTPYTEEACSRLSGVCPFVLVSIPEPHLRHTL